MRKPAAPRSRQEKPPRRPTAVTVRPCKWSVWRWRWRSSFSPSGSQRSGDLAIFVAIGPDMPAAANANAGHSRPPIDRQAAPTIHCWRFGPITTSDVVNYGWHGVDIQIRRDANDVTNQKLQISETNLNGINQLLSVRINFCPPSCAKTGSAC